MPKNMPKTLMLVLALVVSSAWLTAHEYPLTGSSQTRTTANKTKVQGGLQASNEKGAPQMDDHESIREVALSQTEPPKRAHAKAKVTVQSSEAKPYDQTAGPALMEIRLNETFTGEIDGESPVRALQVLRNDSLPTWSACSDSAENCADARVRSCFKVRKSSRTARSRRVGLWFPDQGQVIFPDCVAREALKASLAKAPTVRWIIGSIDVTPLKEPRVDFRRQACW
jgi:hypothetical protein